ncbi:hypothetical protein IFO70_07200 [Phormidium tenue FACHB-886]|nr:hypothetical protein [Phormidium tenue FACHB-886]
MVLFKHPLTPEIFLQRVEQTLTIFWKPTVYDFSKHWDLDKQKFLEEQAQ